MKANIPKILSIIVVILFIPIETFSINNEELSKLFHRANEYYRKGDYSQAEELYQKILARGYTSKEVLFNLGNVYYRLGEFHKSILYLERARLLDPFDEDIKFNLQMANLRIVDKFEEKPKFFIKEWWENLRDSLSSTQWGTLGLVSIWSASVCFSLFLIIASPKTRKVLFLFGAFLLLLFVTSFGVGFARYKFETNHNRAIVFAVNSYIKSSPEESSTDLLILHQGTKVEILDEIGNWYKVRLPNGNIGWIKKSEVEKI